MMEPRIVYRFYREWEAAGIDSRIVTYSVPEHFDNPSTARIAHKRRCEGKLDDGTWWVHRGMKRPWVGPLEVVKDGVVLRDHLAQPCDLPVFAQMSAQVQGATK